MSSLRPTANSGERGRARSSGHRGGPRRQRLAERRARRRAWLLKRGAAVTSLLALALLAWAGVLFLDSGGEAAEDPLLSGSPGLALLAVRDDAGLRAAVVLRADPSPRLLLSLPANTLVQSPGGFQTLDVLLDQGFQEAAPGLEALLGVRPEAYAEVEWDQLLEVAGKVDPELARPAEFPGQPADAAAAAAAFAALTRDEEGIRQQADLHLAAQFGDLSATLASLSGKVEGTQVLPGKLVEGAAFVYFEPDLAAVAALLEEGRAAKMVEVEVQNGSGLLDVTEAAVEALRPLGYQLLPARNADHFPNVETTAVLAAPDVLSEGARVRDRLGLGRVLSEDKLPAGRIEVVIGKDLSLESLNEAALPAAAASQPRLLSEEA